PGWWPHAGGSLARSAERVVAGELPHRDFDEIYTGGLSFLHALAFRLVGTSLLAPRLVLFAVFLAWLPAVYYVAGRFVSPLAAGLATLVAALWTVPNYSEAVPSWYNLFFAVFGVAALLRHLETGGRRWLVVAGVAGGLSCLAKIVGLYYVAAVLLFLVYREHCLARVLTPVPPLRVAERGPGGEGSHAERGHARTYVGTVTAGLLVLVALVAALIRRRAGAVELIDFLVPVAALTAWLTWQLWSEPAGSSRDRFTRLGRLVVRRPAARAAHGARGRGPALGPDEARRAARPAPPAARAAARRRGALQPGAVSLRRADLFLLRGAARAPRRDRGRGDVGSGA